MYFAPINLKNWLRACLLRTNRKLDPQRPRVEAMYKRYLHCLYHKNIFSYLHYLSYICACALDCANQYLLIYLSRVNIAVTSLSLVLCWSPKCILFLIHFKKIRFTNLDFWIRDGPSDRDWLSRFRRSSNNCLSPKKLTFFWTKGVRVSRNKYHQKCRRP